jgi:hypothetical protein
MDTARPPVDHGEDGVSWYLCDPERMAHFGRMPIVQLVGVLHALGASLEVVDDVLYMHMAPGRQGVYQQVPELAHVAGDRREEIRRYLAGEGMEA